jgi:hypothetical protein
LLSNKITRFLRSGRKWPKCLKTLNPLLNIIAIIGHFRILDAFTRARGVS